MIGPNILFEGVIWKIIPKLSLFSLLILSTVYHLEFINIDTQPYPSSAHSSWCAFINIDMQLYPSSEHSNGCKLFLLFCSLGSIGNSYGHVGMFI